MATNNKKKVKWLTVVILAIVFISIIVYRFPNTPTSTWAKIREVAATNIICYKGSSENPVKLPQKELWKLMDATGWPMKTEERPTLFLVSFNNQTDWYLTSIEIELQKKTSKISMHDTDSYIFRNYLGTPLSFIIEKGKYDKVSAISPKSSGKFYFNIGSFLSWEKRGKGYKTEYVFEHYKWKIVAASGYKK